MRSILPSSIFYCFEIHLFTVANDSILQYLVKLVKSTKGNMVLVKKSIFRNGIDGKHHIKQRNTKFSLKPILRNDANGKNNIEQRNTMACALLTFQKYFDVNHLFKQRHTLASVHLTFQT